MRVLPHRLEPIAAPYVAAVEDLAAGAGSAFDLASTLKLATALEDAAVRFDRTTKPVTDAGIGEFNTLVVRLTLARVKDLACVTKPPLIPEQRYARKAEHHSRQNRQRWTLAERHGGGEQNDRDEARRDHGGHADGP